MKGIGLIFKINERLFVLYTAGIACAYIAMFCNCCVFVLLCRKILLSPVTILMQGLALADGLTAFCSYGLEPLFLQHYKCVDISDKKNCYTIYPFCRISTHVSILSVSFHTVSVLITTTMGLQKVIAIMYPVWTKIHMTNRKAVVICVVCFLLAFSIGLPRLFCTTYKPVKVPEYVDIMMTKIIYIEKVCRLEGSSTELLQYSSFYYMILLTILISSCCVVMTLSTVYITHKLLTNRFQGRQTEQRRKERMFVLMILIVVVVFLVSEVPKAASYIHFTVIYIRQSFIMGSFSVTLLARFEDSMAYIIAILSGHDFFATDSESIIFFSFVMEGIKLFTLMGCLSNFFIYICMSKKFR